MAQNRSTDPWSNFLDPSEPPVQSAVRRLTEGQPVPERGLSDHANRVVDALAEARGPLTVGRLHDRLSLTLLEIADAVRGLEERGLVAIGKEGDDDLVLLIDPTAPGRAG